MKFFDFLNMCKDKEDLAIKYLIKELILSVPLCPNCGNIPTSIKNSNKIYKCYSLKNGKNCNFKKSIFSNTIFADSKINLFQIFSIIDNWRKGVISEIVAYDLDISLSTVCNWYNKLNNFIIQQRSIEGEKLIGGDYTFVEVDECLVVKRKYHRGRLLKNQVWIFGGVERGNSKNYFIQAIRSRKGVELLEIIRKKIKNNIIILNDLWKGYEKMNFFLFEKNFLNFTVNHSFNYIDPITGAHTNSIENFWSVYKRVVRKRGTNVGDVQKRINLFHVYKFLKDNRDDIFTAILNLLRDISIYII